MNHKKPTPAEIDEQIQESLAELDKQDADPQPTVETPEVPTPPATPKPDEVVVEPVVEEEQELKKKLSNSARENQILHARTKKFDEAVNEAAKITDVTEEEAGKEYPEWDMMDDLAKKMAKDSIINRRRFEMIHQASQEGKNIQEWQDKVDAYLGDPETIQKNSGLAGKEDDFKIFATKPTRRGLDFEDLTKAFLYDESVKVKTVSKGQMFPTGSGGPNEKIKPKSDKISVTEAASLMKSDYNKWKEYLKAGKIEDAEI